MPNSNCGSYKANYHQDASPFSPVLHRRFGGEYHYLFFVYCWFRAWLIIWPCIGEQYVLPKRRRTPTSVYGGTSRNCTLQTRSILLCIIKYDFYIFTLLTWSWKQNAPRKYRCTSTKLHCVTSWKTAIFLVTAVRTFVLRSKSCFDWIHYLNIFAFFAKFEPLFVIYFITSISRPYSTVW
jgi:hypothetical protein